MFKNFDFNYILQIAMQNNDDFAISTQPIN